MCVWPRLAPPMFILSARWPIVPPVYQHTKDHRASKEQPKNSLYSFNQGRKTGRDKPEREKQGKAKTGEGKTGEGKTGEGQTGEVQARTGQAGKGQAGKEQAGKGQAGEGKAGEGLSVKKVYATQKVYALTSCFQKSLRPVVSRALEKIYPDFMKKEKRKQYAHCDFFDQKNSLPRDLQCSQKYPPRIFELS